MSEIVATPANFGEQLAAADAAMDSDPGDSGGQQAPERGERASPQRSQGENPNPWTNPRGGSGGEEHVNPERRVMEAEEGTHDPNAGHQEFTDGDPNADEPIEGELEAQDGEQGGYPAYEELQQMYKILDGPELPVGLYDKKIPIPGTGTSKTIQQLVEGNMLMRDYSRKSQEVAQMQRQAHELMQNNARLLEGWKNPKVLRATIEKLGLQKSWHEAMTEYAQEQLQFAQMKPEQRQAHLELKELQRRTQIAREEAARAEQSVPKTNPYQAPIKAVLDQHAEAAWAQHGIQPSPVAMQYFAGHMQSIWDGQMESIPQAVYYAAEATAQELQHLARQHYGGQLPQQGQPAQQGNQPQYQQPRQLPRGELPPRAAPGGSAPRGPRGGNGNRDTRFRANKFSDYLDSLPRGSR